MAVATGSTNIDGSTTLISVSGTELEVAVELAAGADITAKLSGLRWDGNPEKIIASGGDATACFVFYLVKKP